MGTHSGTVSSGTTVDISGITATVGANIVYAGISDTAGNVGCYATGHTYTRSAGTTSATLASAATLTEATLNTAQVTVTLANTAYEPDATLETSHFTTSGITGLTVSGYNRDSNTVVTLTLAYTGADFDTDDSFTVTVADAAHTGTGALTSTGSLDVTAIVEPDAATVALTNDTGTSDSDNETNDVSTFTVTVPSDQRSNIDATSETTVYRYAENAGNTCDTPTGSNTGWTSHATETGITNYASGVWTVDGGTAPTDGSYCFTAQYDTDNSDSTNALSEYATAVRVTLDDTDPTAPTGISADATGTSGTFDITVTAALSSVIWIYSDSTCDTRVGTHSGTISSGTTVAISGITATVGANTVYAGAVDTAGNVGCYATGHTYTRSAGTTSATLASAATLTEATLNTAQVTVTLANTAYEADATLETSHFTTSGIAGLTVSGYNRDSNTVVTLTLAYTGADFDTDDSFTVTVADAAHTGTGALTSTGSLDVTAIVEPDAATVALTNDTGTSDSDNETNDVSTFTVTVPSDQRSNIDASSDVTVYRYAENAGNTCDTPTGSNTGWTSHATETGITNYASGVWTVDGGTAPTDGSYCFTAQYDTDNSDSTNALSEYATAVRVTLDDTDPADPTLITGDATGTSGTFDITVTAALNSVIWIYSDSSCTTRVGTHSGTISSGTTVAISGITATQGANTVYAGAVDTAGNVGCYATGHTYTRTIPVVSATLSTHSPTTLTEANLNTAQVDVTLANTAYEPDATIETTHFTTSGIAGLTVSAYSRESNTEVRLTLAYTGADIDADDTFTVTVADAAHTGTGALTSTGSLDVTAIVEPDAATVALTNDTGTSDSDNETNDVSTFTVTVPAGERSNIVANSETTVYRYAENAGNTCDTPTGSNTGWTSHATETGITNYVSGTGAWTVDGATTPTDGSYCFTAQYDTDNSDSTNALSEYATAVRVTLDDTDPADPTLITGDATGTSGTFDITVTAALNSVIWIYSDSSCTTRVGTHSGTISSGTTVAISGITATQGANTVYAGAVDTAGNVGCYATGHTYTRTIPVVSATLSTHSPTTLTEANLNTAQVDVTLANTAYEPDATIETTHFTTSGIAGLTVSAYSRESNTEVRLTLAYTGADIDADDTFTVTVADAAHTGTGALTSTGSLDVTAIVEPDAATVALTNDTGTSDSDNETNDVSTFTVTVPAGERSNIVANSETTVYRYAENAGNTCDTPTGSNTGWTSHATETGITNYVSGTGAWTVDGATTPTDGSYCFTAQYDKDNTDSTNALSEYATAVRVTLDDTDPTAPTAISGTASGTSDTFSVTVTAALNDVIWLYSDSSCATRVGTHSGTVSSGTTVDISGITATVGANTVYAGISDTAGNVGCYGTGHTYTRQVTATLSTGTPSTLTEANLNTAQVDVTVAGTQYEADATLQTSHFTTSGITGLTVSGYSRTSNTVVRLTLAYTGADIDADDTFTVTVADAGHTGTGALTTGSLSVTAIVEPDAATVALTNDTGTSDSDNETNDVSTFTVTVPAGERSNIVANSETTVYRYAENAGNTCDTPTGSNTGWTSHATETGITNYASGVWTVDGGTAPTDGSYCFTAQYDKDNTDSTNALSEYATAVRVTLDDTDPTAPTAISGTASGTSDTFSVTVTAALNDVIWLYSDSSCATRVGTHSGTVSSGTTVDISGITATVGANTVYAAVVDTAGNVGCYGTGHTYTRQVTATLSTGTPSTLTEANLNTAQVDVTVAGTQYEADATLQTSHFTTSGITGLTVSGYSRTSNTVVRLTLAYTGADIDADDTFTVTVADAGHTGTGALTTGSLSVTAIVEPDAATVALTNDTGTSSSDSTTNDVSTFTVTVPSGQRSNIDANSTATVYRYAETSGACAAPTGSNTGWTSHATETGITNYASGVWTVDGGTAPTDGTYCFTAQYDTDNTDSTNALSEYATAVRVTLDDTDPTAPTNISGTNSGTSSIFNVTVTATLNDVVWLYSDSTCSTRVGIHSGTVSSGSTVAISGIAATIGANTVYAAVVDTAGNVGCYATGHTYTRQVTATLSTGTPSTLTEANLNTAQVDVTLANTAYEPDATLQTSHFTTSGITGLTVSGYSRTSNTVVRLTLAYTGADIDADDTFTVTVADAAHTGTGALTSTGSLTVTAIVEPDAATVALTNDTGTSDSDNETNDVSTFTVTVPSGQRSNIDANSVATVYRYAETSGACAAPTGSNTGWTSHTSETGTTNYTAGVWTVDGGTNPTDGSYCFTAQYDTDNTDNTNPLSEYATAVRVTLDDTDPTAPTAITGTASGTSATTSVTVTAALNNVVWLYSDSTCTTRRDTLSGTVSTGTTVDISGIAVNVGATTIYAGVVDNAGNVGCYGTGHTYTRTLPVVSAALSTGTPSTLTEANLNTAQVDVTLANTAYEPDATLQTSHFTTSGITGLTVSGYSRTSNTVVRLTLAYTGADIDADDSFTVTVADAAHTGTGALTSTGSLTVTAIVEPDASVVELTNDTGTSDSDNETNDVSSFTVTVPSGQRSNIDANSDVTVYRYAETSGACAAPTGSNTGWTSHATESGITNYASGTGVWTVDGGTAPTDGSYCFTAQYDTDNTDSTNALSEYATAVRVTLDDTDPTAPTAISGTNSGTGDTFDVTVTAALNDVVWLYSDSTCSTRVGTHSGTVSSGTTVDISGITATVGANTVYAAVVDTAGNVGCYATGHTYTRQVTATLSTGIPSTLTEANLNTAQVDVTVAGTQYEADATLQTSHFTTSGITGLTVSGYSRTSGTVVRLTLAYTGADIDVDDSFTVAVADAAHTGTGVLTTGSLTVTAIVEPDAATVALTNDTGTSSSDSTTNDVSTFTVTVPSGQRSNIDANSVATVYRYAETSGACAAPTGSNTGWTSHATETGTTNYASGVWTVDGGTNPTDGTYCFTAQYDTDNTDSTNALSHYATAVRVTLDDTDPTAPTAISGTNSGTSGIFNVTVTAALNDVIWLYSDSTCSTRVGTHSGTINLGTPPFLSPASPQL